MTEAQEMDRPWSYDEITRKLPVLLEEAEGMLLALRTLGREATRKKWAFEKAKAVAMTMIVADEAQSGIRSNKEMRDARAMLYLHSDQPGPVNPETKEASRVEKSTAQMGYEADLADRAYQDQKQVIRSQDTEIHVLQSMMVSARNAIVTDGR